MDDRELLKKRITEADKTAYERSILKVCGFLSAEEQGEYYRLERGFVSEQHFLNGGHPEAERQMAFFVPEYMDKDEAVAEKISILKITPVNARFSEELNHRDYLGALMNLGIERECTGDIIADRDRCFVFVYKELEEMICRELTRIRHTTVNCVPADEAPETILPTFEKLCINIASERIDAVAAAVFRASRQKAAAAVSSERILINGVLTLSPSRQLKPGDRVSVRGAGKFIYDGISGSSRKGRLFADIRKYV